MSRRTAGILWVLVPAVAILSILALLASPFKSLYYQQSDTMAVPDYFDAGLADFYAAQGLKVERHSQWALLKFLRAGSTYVVTSDVIAASAQQAKLGATFTPLYPETVVVAWMPETCCQHLELRDFSELTARSETIYLDQGVSRLELMGALSLEPQGKTQRFDAQRGEEIVNRIRAEKRLHIGSSLAELAAALERGELCLTTDIRAGLAQSHPDQVRLQAPHSVTYRKGIWKRHDNNQAGRGALPQPPAELRENANATPLGAPTNPGTAAGFDSASPVTNLKSFQEFVWRIGLVNQNYGSSLIWEEANEAIELTFFLITLGVIVFWAGWHFWSSSAAFVRRGVLLQALLFAAWILARIIKHASIGVVERIAWYFYYVPIITSLLIIFLVINHSAQVKIPGYAVISKIAVGAWLALLLGVFTNDIHHQLLIFGNGDSKIDYEYGPLYYGYYLVALLMIGAILFTLFYSLRGLRTKVLLGILSLVGLGLLYSVAYTLRIPLIRETENVQFYILMFLAAWEMLYIVGALKHNIGYVRLFQEAKVPIRLLDRDWHTRFATAAADPLDRQVLEAIRAGTNPYLLTRPDPDAPSDSPGRLWRIEAQPLAAGQILFDTDMTEVRSLEATLRALRNREQHQTDLLTNEYETLRRLGVSRLASSLYNRLDGLMEWSLAEVENLAVSLDEPLDDFSRWRTLRAIKLNLGYAKRAGLLVTQSTELETVSLNLLTTFLSQSCTDFSSRNVSVAIQGPISGFISQDLALSVLEALHRTLNSVLDLQTAVGLVRLEIANHGTQGVLSWVWEVEPSAFSKLAQILTWDEARSSLERADESFHLTTCIGETEQ
ncbi:hypothetical protein [Mobiluncus porci]|uniref:Histidine kinase N-terminal 7TM region domain-containing protein n=1 Tax=Mobiluncus porci TaxID=2652278 RepID=A0A7K0JZT8_9ACTO|nr:hypothetical protein [Mobiluncus porci]MST48674.1 hypothetical protein [Mobiluncus porci]